MKVLLMAALVLLCARTLCYAEGPDEILPYKTINDVTLNLHIFNPPNIESVTGAPVIVFFFGGGWTKGTPKQFYPQCEYLSGRGMVAISAEYRVKSKHGTSALASIEDAKSAVRFVRANAEHLRIDPDRVVAGGGSAGGHVAACTGVVTGFEADNEDKTISSVPNALVLFNPALNVVDIGKFSERFEGKAFEASPEKAIREGLPPTIIFQGTADTTTPYKAAERYCSLAQEKGNVCRLMAIEGQKHGFFNREPHLSETIQHADAFLEEIGLK